MLATVVFRSEDKKSHLTLRALHSWGSIFVLVLVLLVLSVLLGVQKAECNLAVVKRTVAAVEVSWRRTLL